MQVRDIMTTDVVTVGRDASVNDIAKLMHERDIGGVRVGKPRGGNELCHRAPRSSGLSASERARMRFRHSGGIETPPARAQMLVGAHQVNRSRCRIEPLCTKTVAVQKIIADDSQQQIVDLARGSIVSAVFEANQLELAAQACKQLRRHPIRLRQRCIG